MSLDHQRFLARVANDAVLTDAGCWLWTGAVDPDGYGVIRRPPAGFVTRRVHRLVFEMVIGPVPSGLVIDHVCRVRACCNPDHLRAVTPMENTLNSDAAPAALNVRKEVCPRHGTQYVWRGPYPNRPRPYRACRKCDCEKVKRWEQRQRGA